MDKTRAAVRSNIPLYGLLMLVAAFSIFPEVWARITEFRAIRDVLSLTPFHHVTVEQARSDAGLSVRGTMIKRRCEFVDLQAYVSTEGGVRVPVALDVSPERQVWEGGNRPPSESSEYWGHWIVSEPTYGTPKNWEIWATHDCPEGTQVNLFARGTWPKTGGEQ